MNSRHFFKDELHFLKYLPVSKLKEWFDKAIPKLDKSKLKNKDNTINLTILNKNGNTSRNN